MAAKRTPKDPYPALYLEALAYHEAGHAVMAVLLGIPIEKVVIGPNCTEPGFNGRVFLDFATLGHRLSARDAALITVASESAERLAPSFSEFATLHKVHRHLKPFRTGVRNDLAIAFSTVMTVYALLGLAESSAKQRFKDEYRDLAAAFIELTAPAVRELAQRLERRLELDGLEVAGIVRESGPVAGSDQGRRLEAGLSALRSNKVNLFGVLHELTGES